MKLKGKKGKSWERERGLNWKKNKNKKRVASLFIMFSSFFSCIMQ
jgi:hypothetical protein